MGFPRISASWVSPGSSRRGFPQGLYVMGFPRIFTACGRSAPLPFPSQPPWHGLLLLRASVISSPVEGASAGLRFTWKRTRMRSTSGTWNSIRTTTYSSFPDQGKRLFQVCLHKRASYDRNRTETLESERATRKPEHCTLLSNGALCQRMHGTPPLRRTPLMQSMTGLGRELLNRQAIFAYAERGSELLRQRRTLRRCAHTRSQLLSQHLRASRETI